MPEPAKPALLLRFLPSLTDLAFLLPIWILFVKSEGARMLLADGDTGLHIRTGDWILRHKQVPYEDLFSFTKPHQSWFAWEWGWDVIFSLIHRFWGLAGVVLINTLILSFISVLLYRLVRRYSSSDFIAFLLTILAMESSSGHWLARPHVTSWLLTLIFLHIVERHKRLGERNLWILPILTVLWTNLHGSFLVGVIILLSHAIGHAIHALATKSEQPLRSRLSVARQFALYGGLCLAATLINPYGIALHQHVGSYLLDAKQLEAIGEYQSINFHHPTAIYFEVLLGLGIGAAIWCVRTGRLGDAILILLWGHLGLKSFRYIPIYALTAAAPIAAMVRSLGSFQHDHLLAGWVVRFRTTVFAFGRDLRRLERVGRIHIPAFASVVLLALCLRDTSTHPRLKSNFDAQKFPVGAVNFLNTAPTSRLFSSDQWGDYLIYRLFPKMKVFVDDRSDFYGSQFSDSWVRVIKGGFDWQRMLSEYGVDSVLLKTEDPLASVIKQSSAWKTVFDDGVAIIFRRKQPMNKYVSSASLKQLQSSLLPEHKGKQL